MIQFAPARLCGVALLVCSLPVLHAQSRVTDKIYRVQGHAALQLSADDASLRATSCGTCTAVQIHVDMRDADPSRYDLRESQNGNTVRFELKRKSGSSWFSGWARGPEITIQMPTDSSTKLTTGSGSIALRGLHGQQELHTGSGSVTAEEVSGGILADTGSGSIRLHALQATVNAQTGSGSLEAEGRLNLQRLSTGSGSIHLAMAEGSTLDNNALVEAGSGSIDVRLAPSLHANLQASTGSGSIHSDLPITVQGNVDKHELHGILNGGGPTLRLDTGSGSITIRPV